ncbi:MAG: BPL-N domain-containing protein [Legionellaceae bacterium]|nr:BPL-N domain-containing protein [Legionellaceae bacterium]
MTFYRLSLFFYALSIIFFNSTTFAKTNQNIIYIYQDEGVSPHALLQAMHTFQTVLPPFYTVKTIDAQNVIKNDWARDAALFIMPGGADTPYTQKLNGVGNQKIKNYVRHGGSYLGLCAGAYYAASSIEFDKTGPLEVTGTRELAFFDGKAIGPALSTYDYKTESGARAAKINLTLSNNLKKTTVYYNGGGYFEHAGTIKNTTVLGYYANQKPAIISINYAQGHVVLSGVHVEYDAALLDSKNPFLAKLIPELTSANQQRLALVNEVLELLNLTTSNQTKLI